MAPLHARLLHALPDDQRDKLSAVADLEPTVERLLRRCVTAEEAEQRIVDEAVFVQALVRAVAGDVALADCQVEDLYLAAQCGEGDDAALRGFAASYGPELDRAIAKSPTLGLSPEEFRQLVFDRLFVREGQAPARITKYLGKGSLKAWVRVMTSRFVIDLSRRRDRATSSDDGLADKIGAAEDTELDYLRHAYGPTLDSAFEQAVASLSIRERNLLRQRYLHEVPADTMATMYGVHRSTVFLWLDKARAALLGHVRSLLAQRMPGDQLESVVGMLGSKLQLSVRRMLDSRLERESD